MNAISSLHTAERLFSGPIAEEYEKLALICPAAADMSRRVGEFVAGWLRGRAVPDDALELGCGTGVTTAALLAALDEVPLTAVDSEPSMLVQAGANLASWIEAGRLRLVENDALSFLRDQADDSFEVIASAFTLHNFMNGYRREVLQEIFRVLKPGGLFVNGDRYGLDDTLEHTRLIQEEVKQYFKVFRELNRIDLLEHWIVHLFSDESPDRVMRLAPSLDAMAEIGFHPVSVHYRDEVNALVTGSKP
ncbi:methyltransferase, UbiE/COQ5 family [Methylococcus capsulatus str. Bath]|jgi:ubiquinone/menaquinone biosynthesis C-methylase UbiE|uniref:Methyltransferase, UbiE/COQ5 family n=1 Tax=Methylococcus capsulatus (strain ATCC 33009 / NCIMB 11132 / Bath) TaxID=243233 RepID=Q608V5_METCA|nr:class I SAM-dependent methyltransferase [Methylococcus capsulatus]AAU92370.1 methyltransferase, UbiE/COQ5 family [Methylococcus capsulatus str. Bath]